jgi:DNA-binding response OmpR family regulator
MKKTLIVVDDNEAFCRMIADAATRRGWECETYPNGKELLVGLSQLVGSALLLLDVLMPDLDGIETIEELRGDHRNALRIRFMTGGDHRNARAASLIATSLAFDVGETIFKPFSLADLDSILSEEGRLLEYRWGNPGYRDKR